MAYFTTPARTLGTCRMLTHHCTPNTCKTTSTHACNTHTLHIHTLKTPAAGHEHWHTHERAETNTPTSRFAKDVVPRSHHAAAESGHRRTGRREPRGHVQQDIRCNFVPFGCCLGKGGDDAGAAPITWWITIQGLSRRWRQNSIAPCSVLGLLQKL